MKYIAIWQPDIWPAAARPAMCRAAAGRPTMDRPCVCDSGLSVVWQAAAGWPSTAGDWLSVGGRWPAIRGVPPVGHPSWVKMCYSSATGLQSCIMVRCPSVLGHRVSGDGRWHAIMLGFAATGGDM